VRDNKRLDTLFLIVENTEMDKNVPVHRNKVFNMLHNTSYKEMGD